MRTFERKKQSVVSGEESTVCGMRRKVSDGKSAVALMQGRAAPHRTAPHHTAPHRAGQGSLPAISSMRPGQFAKLGLPEFQFFPDTVGGIVHKRGFIGVLAESTVFHAAEGGPGSESFADVVSDKN